MELVQFAGSPEVQKVDDGGAGGNVTATLRPPKGKEWLICLGHTYHDDVAARSLTIKYTDGTTVISPITASVNANTPMSIVSVNTSAVYMPAGGFAPVKLNYNKYIEVYGAGITAGKKVYIEAYVLEVRSG